MKWTVVTWGWNLNDWKTYWWTSLRRKIGILPHSSVFYTAKSCHAFAKSPDFVGAVIDDIILQSARLLAPNVDMDNRSHSSKRQKKKIDIWFTNSCIIYAQNPFYFSKKIQGIKTNEKVDLPCLLFLLWFCFWVENRPVLCG